MSSLSSRLVEMLSAVVLMFCAIYSYYAFMPVTHFYTYESIEPITPVYSGQPLRMISRIDSDMRIPIKWDDAFRCFETENDTDELIATVSFTGTLKIQTPQDGVTWTWGVVEVEAGQTCYIRSVQTVFFPFGIERTIVYNSRTFTVQ